MSFAYQFPEKTDRLFLLSSESMSGDILFKDQAKSVKCTTLEDIKIHPKVLKFEAIFQKHDKL